MKELTDNLKQFKQLGIFIRKKMKELTDNLKQFKQLGIFIRKR